MRKDLELPGQLSRFRGRQRELLEIIYDRGGATIRELYEWLPNPPAGGLHTILNRLVDKGALRKRETGRFHELCYIPALSNAEIQLHALRRIAKLHFGGSRKRAVEALTRMASAEQPSEIAA